ncbi:MAG: hypothetical protein WCC89_02190 [Candidatus Sulfotelmatobacter sp.]
MSRFLLLVAAVAVTSSTPLAVHAQVTEAPPSSIFKLVETPNIRQFPYHSDLYSVSASSATDIWAVGESGVHFDGTKWTAFAMPRIAGDLTSELVGVADLAPNNVWAVGDINVQEDNPNQIIEHYDGTAWSAAAGPTFQPSDVPFLDGLTAISSSDMWAVGSILVTIGGEPEAFPLFENFDGTSWSFTTDELNPNGFLFAVSGAASNDVWSVGYLGAVGATLTEHFDGSAWSAVPSPNPGGAENALLGVTEVASNDAWAVGFYVASGNQGRPQKTLVEHWDGTSWTVVPSPNLGGNNSQTVSNELRGVIAVSANDVWAFGDSDAFGPEQLTNLVIHWDGTKWSLVPTPSPNPRKLKEIDDVLAGGTVLPGGDLWLVGVGDGFDAMVLNATGQ